MRFTVLFFSLIFFLFSCNSETETDNDKKNTPTQNVKTGEENTKAEQFLTIEGKEIWVRNAPTTGEVVMKLNDGDKCKVLQKGEQQTIKGNADFWYEIEFNGKTGWVFGSQTSLKTGIVSQSKAVSQEEQELAEITDFLEKMHSDFNKISNYFYDKQGVLLITNPGAFYIISFTKDLSTMESLIKSPVNCKIEFGKWPKFNMDEYKWGKEGCFAEKVKGDKKFQTTAEIMIEYELGLSKEDEQKAKNLGKQVQIKILNTATDVRYYLGKKNGKWSLIGIDISDFSS